MNEQNKPREHCTQHCQKVREREKVRRRQRKEKIKPKSPKSLAALCPGPFSSILLLYIFELKKIKSAQKSEQEYGKRPKQT